jgi:hypothetical protein
MSRRDILYRDKVIEVTSYNVQTFSGFSPTQQEGERGEGAGESLVCSRRTRLSPAGVEMATLNQVIGAHM